MAEEQQCTEAQFLKDAGSHVMTALRDEGVYRHLRFRKAPPGGSEYWFDLITYPGELVITGDMGTYVFRRLEDMFEFFRTDREYNEKRGLKLGINPQYWGEKLQAIDRSGFKEFSVESFRTNVKQAFDEWVEGNKPYADDDCEDCTKEQREALDAAKNNLWQELKFEVLSCANGGAVRSFDSAREFYWKKGKWAFRIDRCWEWDCEEYTFHFIWCCYAIAWGIKTYDESKITAITVAESEAIT